MPKPSRKSTQKGNVFGGNELKSLGIEPKGGNELKDRVEPAALAEIIAQTYLLSRL
ncbi:MAG TPA: hypothetical protein VHF65_05735 [Nitrososphaera sp.]|nr:hypothetical protein [Nitrososphaera sp.]